MDDEEVSMEKLLEEHPPDGEIRSGESKEACFWRWQGEVAIIRIKCACGCGSNVTLLCERVGSHEIRSKCVNPECGYELVAEVVFVKG